MSPTERMKEGGGGMKEDSPASSFEESPLLDLFRQEVQAGVLALSAGLPALEQGADGPRLESLARAAHAIRGAARMVAVEPAARLAGAVEDALSAARAVGRALPPTHVEALLQAADWLARVAEACGPDFADWEAANAAALEGVLTSLAKPSPPDPPSGRRKGGEESARTLPASETGSGGRGPPPAALPAIDAPLLELFREEVRAHTQALSGGLVDLERAPGDPGRIEPLMRAAHSVKGAARVVNLELAVRIAHLAEDCLVAAQRGARALTPDDIDVLLAAADLLGEMGEAAGPALGEWLAGHEARCAEVALRLEQILSGDGAPPGEAGTLLVRAPARVEPPPPTELAPCPPAPPLEAPAPALVAPAPPERADGARTPDERVVRVTAQSLTRLMGLAGESLVEARWLQPFAGSLLKLKKQQDRLAERLDELWQSPPVLQGTEEVRELVEDARRRLDECGRDLAARIGEFEAHSRQSDDLNSRLYREVIASRMRPFADGAHGFPRLVRDLARSLGKQVEFEVAGQTTEVDRDILEKLEAPLNHLLGNALDHGLEAPAERLAAGKPAAGRLRLEARHNAGVLQITVSDDGRGIDLDRLRRKVVERGHAPAEMAARLTDAELLEFLFLPGFSTAERVTEVSGRGVGLDVVHSTAHAVGGTARVQTRPGQGTTFLLRLPLTLSVIRAVLIEVAGESYAFPLNRIDRLLRLPRAELRSLENRQYVCVDGVNVGIILGRQMFDVAEREPAEGELLLVLFSSHSGQYGLVVDGFRGEQDLVVRPLDARLGKVPNISAAALLDDGSPVLIADVEDLTRSIEDILRGGTLRRAGRAGEGARRGRKRILVVDDSITVREVQRQLLNNRGYEVEVAVDGLDGLEAVRKGAYDLVISDIDMPRMNGLDFVQSLKAEPRLRAVPVVIVSYKDREEDRLRGLEVGANYYLTKSSFHDDRLLQVVEELIGDP
jgi:two-component system, chemotaxis family, sensor histidine kinase and response regulator WspE